MTIKTLIIGIITALIVLYTVGKITERQEQIQPWEYEQCYKETGNRYCNGPKSD